jgi:hypothetical protein
MAGPVLGAGDRLFVPNKTMRTLRRR